MSNEKLRKMLNPYDFNNYKLDQNEFVGREGHIENLALILEDYNKTTKLKNIVINGEKSIGKSTLLNRFDQILRDYNFVTYYKELPRNASNEYDEFDFFKELISDLYYRFAPIEKSCLDVIQQDIWNSLTEHNLNHKSSYLEREINFATQYSNKIKKLDVKFSDKAIEKDMEKIIDALTSNELEYLGFAILIDEFQELSNNTILLDTLRKLSENLTGLIIIGAGLPSLVSNPNFEKFNRTAVNINLKPLKEKEILDLIYKPIETKGKLSRFEIQNCFDARTVHEIVDKSGGNPHHIRVLCANIFDYFKKCNTLQKLTINRDVMENVMEYYASQSEKSKTIKNALETCSPDHLKAFKRLYSYEGLNIRSIILLELAFRSIQQKQEEIIKKGIFDDLKEIYDLKLFEFSEPYKNITEIEKISTIGLSQITYHFIGDAIDKLYASYYYEDLTKEWLSHHGNLKYEDLLAQELKRQLGLAIISKKVPTEILYNIDVVSSPIERTCANDEIIKDYDKLSKLNLEVKDDKSSIEIVKNIAQKHHLDYPAHIASRFDFNGYYVLFLDVLIKNKRRILRALYPIKASIEKAIEIKEQILDYTQFITATLDEYMIEINWIYLYSLSKQAIVNIILVDVNNEMSILFEKTRKRDFDHALKSANKIDSLTMKYRLEDESYSVGKNTTYYNNFAFCLINVGVYDEAKKVFLKLQNSYLVSKLNLSYLLLLEDKWEEAKKNLKKILKKYSNENENIGFLHLGIIHSDITEKNKIVEDVKLLNVVAWNLALICAQHNKEASIAYSFLKKAKPLSNNEKIIHMRVKNWIDFYLKKSTNLITRTENLIDKVKKDTYLYNDLTIDLEIFSRLT